MKKKYKQIFLVAFFLILFIIMIPDFIFSIVDFLRFMSEISNKSLVELFYFIPTILVLILSYNFFTFILFYFIFRLNIIKRINHIFLYLFS